MNATVNVLPRSVPDSQVRSLPRLSPLPAMAIGLASKVAPALVLDQLHRAYFQPQRYRASAEEKAILAEAVSAREEIAGQRIVRYTWDALLFPWDKAFDKHVLLLHGWSGSAAQMTPLVNPLLAAGFRVTAIDAPAHGRAPGEMTTLVQFADVLQALCDGSTAVVAHSLGATASLVAAPRGLSLSKLVLLAPGANVDAYPQRFAEALGAGEHMGRLLQARLLSQYGNEVLRPADNPALPHWHTPTLVVHDVDDREAPYSGAVQLVDTMASARLVSTAGLGHRRILRDAPVIGEVVRFLLQ